MRRLVLVASLVATAALIATGCGGGDSEDDRRADVDRIVFNGEQVSAGPPVLILNLESDRLDRADRTLRRSSAGRLLSDSLPSRDALVRLALQVADIDVGTTDSVSAWLGDRAAIGRRAAWATIEDGKSKQAASFRKGAQGTTTGKVRQGPFDESLEIGTLGPVVDEQPLDETDAWSRLERAMERQGALAVYGQGRHLAVIGSDADGIWVEGRLSDEPICDESKSDALEQLGRLPLETSIGVSAPDRDVYRATKLLGEGSLWLRSADLDLGPAQRALAPSLAAAASITAQLELHAADRDFGIVDAGGTKPRVVQPAAAGSGTLTDDPGFSATFEASGIDAAVDAIWLDPARIARSVGEQRIQGLTGSVVAGLGDGIDGALAWRSCDGGFGARIAIPTA